VKNERALSNSQPEFAADVHRVEGDLLHLESTTIIIIIIIITIIITVYSLLLL
jgi:hypothetical protein